MTPAAALREAIRTSDWRSSTVLALLDEYIEQHALAELAEGLQDVAEHAFHEGYDAAMRDAAPAEGLRRGQNPRIVLGLDKEAAERLADLATDPAYKALLDENDALRDAALAAPAEGLDVERLARYLAEWSDSTKHPDFIPWAAQMIRAHLSTECVCIAREYAALDADTPEETCGAASRKPLTCSRLPSTAMCCAGSLIFAMPHWRPTDD